MADNLNPYKTVLENSSIESKVRGSRFIGTILNVDSKIKANLELDLIRKNIGIQHITAMHIELLHMDWKVK